ncbi:hypothetical protein [uncultured Psychromonas sp.]|uniref:hypothetical protein n=1 Tax=uncultured Psychromonas sp. TaxID=173974 RepID=UPI00261BDD95|nr:hypothetical protein [uncultured Psychromonas sp.]
MDDAITYWKINTMSNQNAIYNTNPINYVIEYWIGKMNEFNTEIAIKTKNRSILFTLKNLYREFKEDTKN